MRHAVSRRVGVAGTAIVAAVMLGAGGAAAQLEESNSERDTLKACERQICEIVVKKDAAGQDFACTLTKTWNRAKIQEGIEKKRLTWGFGNARCAADVAVKRSDIIEAMAKPEHIVELGPQIVKCQVERDKEVTEVAVTLAPRISFKGGKAVTAWLNVKQIDAPTVIRGAIWTVAQVENNFGLFHSEMISEINEFIGQKCPKALAAN